MWLENCHSMQTFCQGQRLNIYLGLSLEQVSALQDHCVTSGMSLYLPNPTEWQVKG